MGVIMHNQKCLTVILVATSIFLPYGVVTTSTVAMTTNQYWLFPLWIYVYDFSNWLNWSFIIPPFLSIYHIVPSVFGLIWSVLGFYTIYAMHQHYENKRNVDSVRFLTQVFLVLQSLTVIIIGYSLMNEYLLYVVPLPIHFLVVLFLIRNPVKDVD